MSALGWTYANPQCPKDVVAVSVGPLAVLTPVAKSILRPRDRLCLQVECFEMGMTVIPLAPTKSVSASHAIRMAKLQTLDLLCQLEALAGFGQMTLLAQNAVTTAHPKPSTGRDWLLQKQSTSNASNTLRNKLLRICTGLPYFTANSAATAQGWRIDLRVPRAESDDFLPKLAQACPQPDPTLHLTASGLWPPHGFVTPLQCREMVDG